MNVLGVAKLIMEQAVKHAPQVLTGIGLVGGTLTIVTAVKAGSRSKELIIDRKIRKFIGDDKDIKDIRLVDEYKCIEWSAEDDPDNVHRSELPKLTFGEIFKCTWKEFIPVITLGLISAGCIVGGQYVSYKRLAAMTAAYLTVSEAANKYQDKIKSLVGKSKDDKAHEELAQEKVNDISDADFNNAQSVDGGTEYFVDDLSGRVFKSTMENVRKAANEFNYQLLNEMWCSVNDYYNWLGLDKNIMGNVIGWNIDKGMVDFRYSAVMRNDHPVTVISPTAFPEPRRSI